MVARLLKFQRQQYYSATIDSEANAMSNYKQRKEDFFKDCHGTSHWEVFTLTQCLPLLLCLGNSLRLRLGQEVIPHQSAAHFTLEVATTLLPIVTICMGLVPPDVAFWTLATLYCCTVLPPLYRLYSVPVAVKEGVLNLNLAFPAKSKAGRDTDEDDGMRSLALEAAVEGLVCSRKMYITIFRGSLMLYTCICILAVDFPAFPRRYAKTEGLGSGLMDVGVGGIILAAGLVSRGHGGPTATEEWQPGRSPGAGSRLGFYCAAVAAAAAAAAARLARGLQVALPCLILGGARFASVKLLGYQEQVGEYGAHWNFFCTIAVVSLLTHVLAVPPRLLVPAAVAVSCSHQIALSCLGLGAWALSPDRGMDLISLNKEGIASCLGYWALHLAGAALAHGMHGTAVRMLQHGTGDALVHGMEGSAFRMQQKGSGDAGTSISRGQGLSLGASSERLAIGALPTRPTGRRRNARKLTELLRWLGMWACLDLALWACLVPLEQYVERRSRRSCNMAYIVWTVAISLSVLLPLAAAQVAWTLAEWRLGFAYVPSADDDRGKARKIELIKGPPAALAEAERHAEASCMPWLPAAASRHMLGVFLFANITTGAINMSMDTLSAPLGLAWVVVSVYITSVAFVAANWP